MAQRHYLDMKHRLCPLPVLKVRKYARALGPGDVLVVETTDPGADKDFQHFCADRNYELIAQESQNGITTHTIRITEKTLNA